MSFDPRAGKRAQMLACLMATTSLCPLGAHAQDAATVTLPTLEVMSAANDASTFLSKLYQEPTSQTETTIPRENILTNTKAFSTWEALRYSPGVTLQQGNGARDVNISIRGSGARTQFGIRNIVMFEDGFPVTQPDGLSRGDLIDLHAYSGIDVLRGPSSALFGNYATGGAVNFRLRRGAEINGIEIGNEGGSFGYLNNYFAYGSHGANWDSSVFFGNAIGNGPTNHNLFNTQTLNFLISYNPTPNDRFFVKGINNTLYNDVSFRVNLNQFYRNPFQANCYGFPSAASANAAGCATQNFFVNGFNGTQVALTPFQSGAKREDRRSILGLRWEHDIDANTLVRVQAVVDDKRINQPTGATTAIGGEPAFNFVSDITSKGKFLGFDSTTFLGVFANTEANTSWSFFIKPGGNANIGSLNTVSPTRQTNMGLRGREEIYLSDTLTAVLGLGVEYTKLTGSQTAYSYPIVGLGAATTRNTIADNAYYNIAPEGGLLWRASPDWLVHTRLGTGYGTPQASNLFTLPNGDPGNNTQLKTQTNIGVDLGATYSPAPNIYLDVTGFYEWFYNELVTQVVTNPTRGNVSFQFNAPKSEHRGVEVAGLWEFLPGWRFRAIYTYLNQIYTDYFETLGFTPTGGRPTSNVFNRAGNWIPGVVPNSLTLRLGYDVPDGPLKGLGTFAEYFLNDSYYIDNGNILKVPGYQIVNLNFHYDTELTNSFFHKIGGFFEIRNIGNVNYIAGANNITNTLNAQGVQNGAAVLANSTGSIYAGFPRTFVGGLKFTF
jgi:iron complex outermembrane receptor protein